MSAWLVTRFALAVFLVETLWLGGMAFAFIAPAVGFVLFTLGVFLAWLLLNVIVLAHAAELRDRERGE